MWRDLPLPGATPRRLARTDHPDGGVWVVYSTYLAKDTVGRDRSYFSHLYLVNSADPAAVLRLADSPIFVSWAVRRLGLSVKAGPVTVPVVRVQVPSLAVVPGTVTYHLVSPQRLRITGDWPAATFELDAAGTVVYQAGHLRLAR
jgi:hypothetical protein